MGAAKLVHDFGCGLTFKEGDIVDLANKICMLANNKSKYLEVLKFVRSASSFSQPETVAARVGELLSSRYHDWRCYTGEKASD
jgi:hypothetical protein